MKVKKAKPLTESKKLNEEDVEEIKDPAIAKLADKFDMDEFVPWDASKGEMYEILNDSLDSAIGLKKHEWYRRQHGKPTARVQDYPNILFIGGAGTGKTGQIRAWAEDAKVNLFTLQGASLDAADMGGLPMVTTTEVDPKTGAETKKTKLRAQKVGTGMLDQLDRPRSVLFLDELNRARPDVQAALLQLICEHIVQDFEEDGGMRYFPNFLFTIAAINPSNDRYGDTYELDSATKGRFSSKDWVVEKQVWRKYAVDEYTKKSQDMEEMGDHRRAEIERGRAAIADALVSSPDFYFDDMESEQEAANEDGWNGLTTTPRNLTILLNNCNGTKDDFLKKWSRNCNSLHEPIVNNILGTYEDVIDAPNKVFSDHQTRSTLFTKREPSGVDAIRRKYGNL